MKTTEAQGQRRTKHERGATMLDYALLVALLCIVAIGGVRTVGQSVKSTMSKGYEPLLGSAGVDPLDASGSAPARSKF